jgi:hypothetical protein
MKEKRMITPFEKMMLEKGGYADSLKDIKMGQAAGVIDDLPKSAAVKAADAGAEFAEKRGKDLMKRAAKEGALLKLGGKLGGKGLGKAAALALTGPVGMMISGAAEAADSVPTGPEQGSIDAIIESPDYSAEEKQRMIQDIKDKERIMMRKRALREKLRRPDALDEMNADVKRYKDIAEKMDPRSPEQLEAEAAERQANIEANRPDVKQERAEGANSDMNRMLLERMLRR